MSWRDQRHALERWSRAHAAAMLLGCGLALAVGHSWPAATLAAVSFALLIFGNARAWTPRGGFGAANLITALRLGVTLAIGFGWGDVPSLSLAGIVLVLFVLDGVDGWLARRFGTASRFGACFDMETDALMVLVAALLLWQRRDLGGWILTAGLLRYVYVIALALVPARSGSMPRSRIARYSFTTLVLSLVLALALPKAAAIWAAAIGTAVVTASFARAFHWSYRSPSSRDGRLASLPDAAPGR
jgi:phosphatidylglycerophosphate synthase